MFHYKPTIWGYSHGHGNPQKTSSAALVLHHPFFRMRIAVIEAVTLGVGDTIGGHDAGSILLENSPAIGEVGLCIYNYIYI